jgi:acetyl esterase
MKNNFKNLKAGVVTAAFLAVVGVSCSNGSNESITGSDSTQNEVVTASADSSAIKPKGQAPEWAPSIKPEMQAVIEQLVSYGDKPIEDLTAKEARKNHTPTDAVMDLMKANNIAMPPSGVDTAGKEISVAGGNIHLRTYTPKAGKAPYPVIVYYHGGGFVIANIDVYDASAKGLAEQTGAIVVSVAYRLAPEHKYPTAHMDSYAAYEWVVKNAASMNGDPKKIAVAGESAGGNLAVNVAIMARDKGQTQPLHILAVYPIAQADMNTASYQKNANAKPLNKAMMAWFTKNYVNSMDEAKKPLISLVNANLKGLPPTTIVTAELDPLQSDGMMLTDKLKAAGVKVESKNYDGVTHEFFGMAAVVPEAKAAQAYGAGRLKAAF